MPEGETPGEAKKPSLRDRALFAARDQRARQDHERQVREAALAAEVRKVASERFKAVTALELSPDAWRTVSTAETRATGSDQQQALVVEHDGIAFLFLTHSYSAGSGDLFLGARDQEGGTWRRVSEPLKTLVDLGKALEAQEESLGG